MRKKSHISLARYLVAKSGSAELKKHRLAFYLGSILPDCKLSFIYRRHEIGATFEDVKKEMIRLAEEEKAQKNRRAYYRNLGQVSHYIADYFTFPHNAVYPGTLSDHCSYEELLKRRLREYLTDGEADSNRQPPENFDNVRELAAYILEEHRKYLQKKLGIEEDIRDIVRINCQMMSGMMHFSMAGAV